MFGLQNPEFYLFFLLFLFGSFISVFIPGWVALSIAKFKSESLRFLLAPPVGLALWGIQGFALGYTHLRFLTPLYILIFAIFFWREQGRAKFKDLKKVLTNFKSMPLWFIFLILFSSFLQIFNHIGSGLMTPEGLPFYFVNSVDGVLHLAYIQELVSHFPPQEPGAFGLPLVNYHYWSDLVQAELIRVWQLPTIHVFFQYMPIVLSVWTTMLFLRLISYLGGSRKAQLVGLLLITLGGDASYIITQILHAHWGPNVASLDSGVSFYFNIPQVYARFVFLGVIFLLTKWLKSKNFGAGFLLTLLIASLFGFKIYYALYAVFGFCFVIGFQIISDFIAGWKKSLKEKSIITALNHGLTQTWQKNKLPLVLVIILAVISLTIYLPTNKGAGGLTFSFFEWPHLLLSANNIDYIDWFLRMQVYEWHRNIRNIIIFNLWAVFLTFVAVYGTRMLGLWPMFKTKNEHMKKLFLFFIPANTLFILLGLLTLQTSGGLNIFNFLIVPILSFNIFAAMNLGQFKTKIFVPVFFVVALLTIPRSYFQLKLYNERYQINQTDSLITQDELEAFNYLRKQKNIVVQTTLENHYNFQTPYVSFLSNNPTYISGVSMLESHNQLTRDREANVKNALAQTDVSLKASLLADLGVTHFIISTEEYQKPNNWLAEVVFQNESITILRLR